MVASATQGSPGPPTVVTTVPASTALLLHDFPVEEASADRTGRGLPLLADRLAAESGWRVVAGCLRGVGGSAGDFCLSGWLEDARVLVDHASVVAAGGGVWVVGFGVGGSIGLGLADADQRVRGVGCLGSPATFVDWARDPSSMLEMARRIGVVRSSGFPPSLPDWAHDFAELNPLEGAASLARRALLIVHGVDDDVVPLSDARQLADAAGAAAELRMLPGAGHRLRADPRAMALLVGWLERQGP